jgi:hypothetical protein
VKKKQNMQGKRERAATWQGASQHGMDVRTQRGGPKCKRTTYDDEESEEREEEEPDWLPAEP